MLSEDFKECEEEEKGGEKKNGSARARICTLEKEKEKKEVRCKRIGMKRLGSCKARQASELAGSMLMCEIQGRGRIQFGASIQCKPDLVVVGGTNLLYLHVWLDLQQQASIHACTKKSKSEGE